MTLHFRIFGWLVAIFVLLLGFIDRRGLGSAPPFGGFVPVFDSTLYVQLGSQFAVLLLSSTIVFVYSYFFMCVGNTFTTFADHSLPEPTL